MPEILSFDPKNNIYLCIRSNRTIEQYNLQKKSWLGRLFAKLRMRLGLSDASFSRVVAFLEKNPNLLHSIEQKRLKESLHHYSQTHKKYTKKIEGILTELNTLTTCIGDPQNLTKGHYQDSYTGSTDHKGNSYSHDEEPENSTTTTGAKDPVDFKATGNEDDTKKNEIEDSNSDTNARNAFKATNNTNDPDASNTSNKDQNTATLVDDKTNGTPKSDGDPNDATTSKNEQNPPLTAWSDNNANETQKSDKDEDVNDDQTPPSDPKASADDQANGTPKSDKDEDTAPQSADDKKIIDPTKPSGPPETGPDKMKNEQIDWNQQIIEAIDELRNTIKKNEGNDPDASTLADLFLRSWSNNESIPDISDELNQKLKNLFLPSPEQLIPPQGKINVGIRNIDKTCWLNSALKMLATSTIFDQFIDQTSPEEGNDTALFRKAFIGIFCALRTGKKGLIADEQIHFFFAILKKAIPLLDINKHNTQDASEFILYAMNLLQKNILPDSGIQSGDMVFRGKDDANHWYLRMDSVLSNPFLTLPNVPEYIDAMKNENQNLEEEKNLSSIHLNILRWHRILSERKQRIEKTNEEIVVFNKFIYSNLPEEIVFYIPRKQYKDNEEIALHENPIYLDEEHCIELPLFCENTNKEIAVKYKVIASLIWDRGHYICQVYNTDHTITTHDDSHSHESNESGSFAKGTIFYAKRVE